MAWTPKFTFSVTWDNITGKPLNYPTTWSLVGGKPSTFPSTWATVSGKPATATRWPTWEEVTGKPAIPDASDFVARSIPDLDPIAEIESGNYGTVVQPFRIGRNSSIDPPSFSTNLSPYLWLGSSGSSGQQGALIAVHAASASSNQQMAFRGRSGSGWGPWSYLWHSGNFDPDSKAPVENPVFEGDLTVSTSLASGGVIVERRNQPFNSSIEYKTTDGSLWAGYGNNGTIGFSVGGSSNLTASNTWFKAQDGAAYIYQGSTPHEVYHEGNTVPMADNGVARVDNSWDNITQSGVYYNTASSTAPTNHVRYALLHMQQPGGQFGQLAIRSGADNFFIRRADSGAVGDWCELYHTGNFDPSNYVTSNSAQTGLSGDKTWTGNHTFTSSSNTDSLTVERTGSTARNAYVAYSTSATTIYAGIANINNTTWGIGTSSNLTSGNTQFQFDTSTGNMSASGTISDSTGDVRKLRFITRNAATTLAASHLNGAVEKSNNSSYTYTIPAGLGSQGDAITFVNSGTGGNLTISRATNVSLYRNGTDANIVVSPGSMITIYRSATNNRWIA